MCSVVYNECMPTTPAYAKVKTITSRSGAAATGKHITTLERAAALLDAQGDYAASQAAMIIRSTIAGFRRELVIYYRSEHNPYRNLSA